MTNDSTQSNASKDTLVLKVPTQDLAAYLAFVRLINQRDKVVYRQAREKI